MSIGLKGNVDGSGAVQVGGTDAITIATDTTVTMNGGVQRPLLSGTSVASTSGTSIDFTGIPSWVKRITVMFNGVSTSGTSDLIVQVGTSGGVVSTGYVGAVSTQTGTATNFSASFIAWSSNTAATVVQGHTGICLVSGNTWACSGVLGNSAAGGVRTFGGTVPLSGTLDRVRITTAGGTDTFDAGSINILYE